MSDEEDDIVLSELSDEDLVQQMHDDLYDGLTEEIVEGTQILPCQTKKTISFCQSSRTTTSSSRCTTTCTTG